ncbi:hypothetical protein AGDE_15853 [Angomonas deanei]|uniref:Uncharacterized protein n=1 Tax=Angomonas deanei TaxID=59799 RepID=A0A7G2CBA7_9TRYP|nr:hypothetical protein AGDE_15853 [Angomonas deanei]CAD2216207.1 hypothetical protein, conserved [Angomonas deanei]|eukprot:EPY18266.1 hypothetical protein AGDE_15853 [Angomonas deanei]
MYGKARHLLLSQGSIDDVFEGDGSGRLRYLRDYFYKEYTNAKLAEERAKETKKKGVSSWFNCGGTEEKQPHTGVTNPSVIGKGSLLIRLSTIQGPVEGPGGHGVSIRLVPGCSPTL